MTDAGQRSLGDFNDERRQEAEAVAGEHPPESDRVISPEQESLPGADGSVALAVTQVDYTITGSGDSEEPIIHVFGRTADGTAEHVRVRGFQPYFYAPIETVDEAELRTYDRITGWDRTGPDGTPFESIRGQELYRIYGQTPRDVGELRDEFEHYEADILFPDRFLIDKNIKSGIAVPERRSEDGTIRVHHEEVEPADVNTMPRVCFLDIEVDDRRGFPEDGEEPIVCLTTHDSRTDRYIGWLYTPPTGETVTETLADYELLTPEDDDAGRHSDIEIRSFDTEAAMLDAVIAYLNRIDADVLSGWNFTDFDAPYLLDRLEVLDPKTEYDLAIDRLSRVDEVWRSDWGGPDIKGRVVFDLLYAYQRTKFTELDSYRLDDVAEMELGVGKERYQGDLGDLWEEDPERLLEYNLRDVELCVELNQQQDIIPFWNEVRSFVGCRLEDATTPGDAVDMYVLQKVHGEYALPSKGQHEGEDYEGGAVFDPITGVREMVSVLDLKCFSPDTEVLTPDGVVNITDLAVGDAIYTLDPETLTPEVTEVAETHCYENSLGELQHLAGDGYDFKVTSNHQFLVAPADVEPTPEAFELREYRNIPDDQQVQFPTHEPISGTTPATVDLTQGVSSGRVQIRPADSLEALRERLPTQVTRECTIGQGPVPAGGGTPTPATLACPVTVYQRHRELIEQHASQTVLVEEHGSTETDLPTAVEPELWLRFLGRFLATGGLADTDRVRFEHPNSHQRAATKRLLDQLGIPYDSTEHAVQIQSQVLYERLADRCYHEGHKQVPRWIQDLDGAAARTLLETLATETKPHTSDDGQYAIRGTSPVLKEDLVDLALRCGYHPSATAHEDGTWTVRTTTAPSVSKMADGHTESHDGTVHCITGADNHVILAGRNGQFQWVGQSLYPMCMVTINASPETKVDPAEHKGETYRAPNGTRFRKSPDGVIREMVDELLTERERKKERRDNHDPATDDYERFDRQQAAVKVIMNSLYGVLGWDRFRLYDKEMGAAVTATGREVISFTEEVANEIGYEVAYGDTDSVMLELGEGLSKEDAIEQSFDIEERINKSYDDFAREELNAQTHRFQIEFEKLYRRFFQAGKKKRYAGHIIWSEGKDVDETDITGFEYQRSDIAPITKEVQLEVIERIVHGEETDAVTEYVHGVIEEFLAGDIDPEEIAIPGGIGKRLSNYETDTAQVRGAKYANLLLGTNFGRGSKPKRVYLKKVHPEFFRRMEEEEGFDPQQDPLYREFKRNPDVICFEYADQLPAEFQIDWEKMLDKTLKGPIARIFEALDISWEEVRSGQEQTGLGQFM